MWARELGRALALVHAVASDRLADLPSVFDRRGSQAELNGPLAPDVRSAGRRSSARQGVAHCDYWSGNVVGGMDGSPASLTGRVQHAVHAATTSAGAASISFSCSTSESLTSSSRPTKPPSANPRRHGSLGRLGRRSLARHRRDLDSQLRAPGARRPRCTRTSPAPLTLDGTLVRGSGCGRPSAGSGAAPRGAR